MALTIRQQDNTIILKGALNTTTLNSFKTHFDFILNTYKGVTLDIDNLAEIDKSTMIVLKEIYKNVDKSKKIVLYCAIGRIAATNYFALRELDYDVSNYDASWKEWGNDSSLPITNPSKD